MKRYLTRKTLIVAGILAATAAAAIGGGAAIGAAGDDDETERPITGAALQRASAAALEHTGGGRVTDSEVGDEESMYEIEVSLPNGDEVDVQLDERFDVVGTENDGGEGDDD